MVVPGLRLVTFKVTGHTLCPELGGQLTCRLMQWELWDLDDLYPQSL